MKIKHILAMGTVIGLVCAAASPIEAQSGSQGRGQGKPAPEKKSEGTAVSATVQVRIGPRDRQIITDYYTARAMALPPGLAKRGGDLPPGLEKQLERNGTLPPGLQKKLEPMPVQLERQLAHLPDDYHRFVLGAHILILSGKHVIADTVLNVVK
jgi:hypothetical protein